MTYNDLFMGQIMRFMPLCWRLQHTTPRGSCTLFHEHLAPLRQIVKHISISMSDRQKRQVVGPFQAKPWAQSLLEACHLGVVMVGQDPKMGGALLHEANVNP